LPEREGNMGTEGYYIHPFIRGNTIVFISDDDIWSVDAGGGLARRLTSGLGFPSTPFLSPDGTLLAFTGREEGNGEVYIMPAPGGEATRITYTGDPDTRVAGWSPDGKNIIYVSSESEAFRGVTPFYEVSREGGHPRKLPFGWGASITFGPSQGAAIGRQGRDPAQWKRYRGGRMGEIWIDREGSGSFVKLPTPGSNVTCPNWIGNRIYFMGDHEGYGNIYSFLCDGTDLKRHTDHDDFYVRNPRSDGKSIVYHAGGDIFLFDIESDQSRKVEIEFRSPRRQRMRKFAGADRYLETFDIHPEGHALSIISRGRPFTFAHWEGAVLRLGKGEGEIRYRLARWLPDGRHILVVSDEGGEETLEIRNIADVETVDRLDGIDAGRTIHLKMHPSCNLAALTNQRQELILVNLDEPGSTVVDRSEWRRIDGLDWSPDGRWLAYGFATSRNRSVIRIYDTETGKKHTVTRPLFIDRSPSFDPSGKYLYFLSIRKFDPVVDNVKFGYGFPRAVQPMLLTLRNDIFSPFVPEPSAPGESPGKDKTDKKVTGAETEGSRPEPVPVQIDMDGIEDRVLAFPVPEGIYSGITGGSGAVYFLGKPVEGTLSDNLFSTEPSASGNLEVYDFTARKHKILYRGVSRFKLGGSGKVIAYTAGRKLRVIQAGVEPEKEKKESKPGRESGWIDLRRAETPVHPESEWRQMYRETWRLLRDQFYASDMAGVDWERMYAKYLPIVGRVSTRIELSDLLWELGGELGTSHCYEIGGDHRVPPRNTVGRLGAEIEFDEKNEVYVISRLIKGDTWDEKCNSPLNQPGINIRPGDVLLAVNGRTLSREEGPGRHLLGMGGKEVTLSIRSTDGEVRNLTVKSLTSEKTARLREKINNCTEYVHGETGGRVGYLYMEDMGSSGFSQFWRAFPGELEREALIIDVRNNAGGHVSSLLLEKLARRRTGFEVSRYSPPMPSPPDCIVGPILAICDEFSGSDGDIFSHVFKRMKLGPLVGKRTWGGIVGLNPTHLLVDGSITTQPEFFNWYDDVGWGLENRGAEPDIFVEISPHDAAAGNDPQLDRAIAEILRLLDERPDRGPALGPPPSRTHPKLPPRPEQ